MKRYLQLNNIGRLATITDKGEGELGVITDASCLIKQGRIEWIGKNGEAPELADYLVQELDVSGATVMPGLVDCHTHLVHAGSRQNEMVMRARGATYEEIAEKGGGILSTVKATRAANFEELCKSSFRRANESLRRGTTTIEVKSGYGLDLETELKMLNVVKWLNANHHASFIPTFMGAHTLPSEYKSDRKKYVDLVVNEMIPAVVKDGLAEFCDVFVEKIAFTIDEARIILDAAKDAGMKLKIHVDQLTFCGGAELAAEVGAISAEHLDHVSKAGIRALSEASVTAVMIPGSTFFLGSQKYAPARDLIDAGVTVAIATDYNPGTTPVTDLFLMATIAVSYMRLTMEEAIKGITVNAAKALGLTDGQGTVTVGGVGDLIVLDAPDEYFPLYRYGTSSMKYVIKEGKIVYEIA